MSDSARWCATCNAHGDHHTDRHDASVRGALTAPSGLRTLAPATCLVHRAHSPSIRRANGLFTVENHHIHPKEFGGPDTADNLVYICPTGHSAVHELLRAEVKAGGRTPWGVRRHYHPGDRDLALEGFLRIQAAGRLPAVRRTMGLPE